MQLGDKLDDAYVVVAPVGSGRFSDVFKGVTLGDPSASVAIKVLKERLTNNLYRESFEREVQALRTLSHPNIVRLLAAGTTSDGFPYLVTEFCPKAVAAPGKWDPSIIEIADQLLAALQHAHAAKVIHRDLKPQHVMLGTDLQVKIIDFGIAAIRGRLGQGLTLGAHFTAAYACEDQAKGLRARPQYDLYGVAGCLYWLLTGKDPDSEQSLASQIKELPVQVPSTFKDFMIWLASSQDDTLTAGTARRQLETLSQKWISTEEFTLVLSPGAREKLASLLDQSPPLDLTKLAEAASEDLYPSNTAYPALAVGFRGATDPEAFMQYPYRLMGRRFLWRLSVHAGGRAFLVTHVEELDPDELDGQRQTGFESLIDWYVVASTTVPAQSKPVQPLARRIIELERQKAKERDDYSKRAQLVDVWDNVFKLQRQLLSDPADTVEYSQWEDNGSEILVTLSRYAEKVALWPADERLSMTGRSRQSFVSVGALVERLPGQVRIKPDPDRLLPELALTGRIAPDKRLQYSALRRQQEALATLKGGTSVNSSLSGILSGTVAPAGVQRVVVDSWFDADIDDAKKDAVIRALGTQDLLLIQGPPGTGKTVAIAELVLQIRKRHPADRILLASQSNVAIDQAIERLVRMDPHISLARLGWMEDKVSLAAQPWHLTHRTVTWREQVLAKSKIFLDSIGVSPGASLPTSAVRELIQEVDELESRKKGLDSLRRSLMGRIGAARRQGSEQVPEEVRDEVELIDEELESLETNMASAIELIEGFFTSHGFTGENARDAWGERLTAIERAESLRPDAGLAVLWDEWSRQFGRGLPYEAALAKRSRILAGTCLGVAGHLAVQKAEFDWVIVDEAGRATPPELLVPLVRGKRAILVGDHKQLPPVLDRELTQSQLDDLSLERADLEKSLFQMLYETLPDEQKVVLNTQYRMAPGIGSMISALFYENVLKTGTGTTARSDISWPTTEITWVSTSKLTVHTEARSGTSYMNRSEVQIILDILKKLKSIAPPNEQAMSVGIITAYEGQRSALDSAVDATDVERWHPMNLEVNTVDAFQGRERDVIIYSAARSNPTGEIGFLSDLRRINVALSRARSKLIIVGDADMLRFAVGPQGLNPFKGVLDWIKENPSSATLVNGIE